MLRRPRAGDTEEDLLAFQADFLAAGERPAARVGEKRHHQQGLHKDVVKLKDEGLPAVMEEEVGRPPVKRSKFKERRERLQASRGIADDPHKAMDKHDSHITRVLSDIKEREVPPPLTMPVQRTRLGFPTAHKLASPLSPTPQGSLFAQQFASHSPEFFGLEAAAAPSSASAGCSDMAGPVQRGLQGTGGNGERGKEQAMEVDRAAPLQDSGRSSAKDGLENRLSTPSLISGEGLVGVAGGGARDAVAGIHQENVERLAGCSEQEILAERERILQLLGSNTVAFLQSKRQHGGGPREEEEEEEGVRLAGSAGPLHMQREESEKLEWMTDTATPSLLPSMARDVRFSLDGLVVPSSLSLPAHLGLHHHGDEPQAAGYTLTELLPLCRSAVLQQRVLALQTLATILTRARCGEYRELVEGEGGGVLEVLLASPLPLLLRHTLDEGSERVYSAAVRCLHALLVPPPLEESLLDEYCSCYHSYLPALRSPDQSHDSADEEREIDSDVIRSDVIKGYVRMKLPHRLRYILEVCRPPRETVTRILELLVRISRHSLEAASTVLHCPRLIKVVLEEFLPLAWSSQEQDSAHGRPHQTAMKLLLVLCSAGRNIAAQLVSQYKLVTVLLRYALPHPSALCLPLPTAHALTTTALHTWATLLCYGLADEAFRDTLPELLQQLHHFSSLPVTSDLPAGEPARLAAVLQVFRAAVGVASLTPAMLKLDDGNDHPSPAVGWSHMSGLLAPLRNCLDVWLSDDRLAVADGMRGVASLLHCLADYCHSLPAQDPVGWLEHAEGLASAAVLKLLLQSPLYRTALQTLQASSTLSNGSSSPPLTPAPASLPSHLHLPPAPRQAVYGRPQTEPAAYDELLQTQRLCLLSCDLLCGHLRLALTLSALHKGVVAKMGTLVQNQQFLEYLGCFVATPLPKLCSSLQFPELSLLHSALQLFAKQLVSEPGCVSEPCLQLFHLAGFKLLSLLPPGWEWPAMELLSSLLHPTSFCLGDGSLVDLGSLSLRDPPHSCTTLTPSQPPPFTLLSHALAALPSITHTYRECLERAGVCRKTAVRTSKLLFSLPRAPPLQPGRLLPPNSAPLFPVDWPLLPLLLHYTSSLTTDSKPAAPSGNVVAMVTHSLQLVLLLELLRPEVLREVPTSAKLARLMCTFLIDSDLFLEGPVRSLLTLLLRLYCSTEAQHSLNFDLPIPGLTSFHDLYSALLQQFAAVSYSDALFAGYVVLPLQQRFTAAGLRRRRQVWGEHATVLRLLALPLDQLPVDVKWFLEPVERDAVLLEAYLRHLANGTVRWQWSPLFYVTAVHHIHSFVFLAAATAAEEGPLQRRLLEGVLALGNTETRHHLLLYRAADTSQMSGLCVRPGLSDWHRTRMEAVLNRSVDFSSLLV